MTKKEQILIEAWANQIRTMDTVIKEIEAMEEKLKEMKETLFKQTADEQINFVKKYCAFGGDTEDIVAALEKELQKQNESDE